MVQSRANLIYNIKLKNGIEKNPKMLTLDALNSFTTIRRESSENINHDRAPVLSLQ